MENNIDDIFLGSDYVGKSHLFIANVSIGQTCNIILGKSLLISKVELENNYSTYLYFAALLILPGIVICAVIIYYSDMTVTKYNILFINKSFACINKSF